MARIHTDEYRSLQGDHDPYYILRHKFGENPNSWIEQVVFKHVDPVAKMPVEILVHWTQVFNYIMRRGPGYHTVTAVVLKDGSRIWADTRTANAPTEKEWLARPPILRSSFSINCLCGSHGTLLEIKGARAYAYSRRDQAALDAFTALGAQQPVYN